MTRAIDTSLTLIDKAVDEAIDVHLFADANRYMPIWNRQVGDGLEQLAEREAKRRTVQVGGTGRKTDVEFFVLDLRHDKTLMREVARLLHHAFVDATASVLKGSDDKDGFLGSSATGQFDTIEELIKLRRFIANANAASARKRSRELLFHHAMPQAAE